MAAGSTPLTDWLVGFQNDARALEACRRDPRRAAAALPRELRRLVLTGDRQAIDDAVFVELAAAPPREKQRRRTRAAGRRRSRTLSLVGTGIALGHVTAEARSLIEGAEKLFALVVDPVTYVWLARLNPSIESLQPFYTSGKSRASTYRDMVDHVMRALRRHRDVTVAFYGHPAVGSIPAHEMLRRASHLGVGARLVPAVSAADCLFAELGVDAAADGLQSVEATNLIVHRQRIDPTIPLVIWQCGVVGRLDGTAEPTDAGVDALVATLAAAYPGRHRAVLFEASAYPCCRSRIEPVRIDRLRDMSMSPMSTLYVPPAGKPRVDRATARRLAL